MLLYGYKKNDLGIVLISVLLFLQLWTMLGLYLLQASLFSQKISQTYRQHYSLLSLTNNILQGIELHTIPDDAMCMIRQTTRHDLVFKSFDWWQTYACKQGLDKIDYYYVIEPLSVNVCMKSHDDVESLIPVKYFRITLLAYSNNKVFREFLQSTVIKLDNTHRDCADGYVDVRLGRQSWRRL